MSKFTNSLKGAARGVKRSPKAAARLAGKAFRAVRRTVRTALVWIVALPLIFKQRKAAKVAAEKEAQAFVDEVFANFDAETFVGNFTDHSASYDENLTYKFVDEDGNEVELAVSDEGAPQEAADRKPFVTPKTRSEKTEEYRLAAEEVNDVNAENYWYGAYQAASFKEVKGEKDSKEQAWAFLHKTLQSPLSTRKIKKVREGWKDEFATAHDLINS